MSLLSGISGTMNNPICIELTNKILVSGDTNIMIISDNQNKAESVGITSRVIGPFLANMCA